MSDHLSNYRGEKAEAALAFVVELAGYWRSVAEELVGRLASTDDEAHLMMEAYEQAEP